LLKSRTLDRSIFVPPYGNNITAFSRFLRKFNGKIIFVKHKYNMERIVST